MYFPIGWPRMLNLGDHERICSFECNRNKSLFGIVTINTISIWYCKPCVPLILQKRSPECLIKYGRNFKLQWRPESTMLVIATDDSYLLFYKVVNQNQEQQNFYEQKDSPICSLKRDSAELFSKDFIPSILLIFDKCTWIDGGISSIVCIRDELMISTKTNFVLRYKWDGTQNRDYSLDLRRIPFSNDQQISTLAMPLTCKSTHVIDIEYSPEIGGFSVVFNSGKGAFLTAESLKFDPNQVQGVWIRDVDDITCTAVNHKYRLIAFGRTNSQSIISYVDESLGSLELSHILTLSTKDYPGVTGSVSSLRWTPDSCAIAVAWSTGGMSIWSTFGALLLCTLKWDYGHNIDSLQRSNFQIIAMEWAAEGYQLWILKDSYFLNREKNSRNNKYYKSRSLVQWNFVKSPITVNPCMSHNEHIYLQGEDCLYINLGHKIFSTDIRIHFSNGEQIDEFYHVLPGTKQWLVVPIPHAYTSCNSPVRFTAIDEEGQAIAVAGKRGVAHYSIPSRKWKLFGSEHQESDFIVTGGLIWYREFLITSSYSISKDEDQLRLYPKQQRLDNKHVKIVKMPTHILLLNILKNLLLAFCANNQITMFRMKIYNDKDKFGLELIMIQTIDISSLCPHPICLVSANLSSIYSELADHDAYPKTLLLNISGKLIMVHRHGWPETSNLMFTLTTPTVLASSVENVWISWKSSLDKRHLSESVWIFCGVYGMRVWLPLFPKNHHESAHTFMGKRIMLPFYLKIYPLTVLFEDAILLGVENETVLYTSDSNTPFIFPFSVLKLTSQVYLHQVLRQLIHRNLGFQAWQIARSCSTLPYFSHSLELLLHEVLEEEATSKEPLPDAQLPSIVEFIQEFPGYWAQAIVQCARKTEIALWPYLFSVAGSPKKLLQICLNSRELDTAASYLLILQNLDITSISKKYATLLLDASLEEGKWQLSKDLVRFLRAIDPHDVDIFKTSTISFKNYSQSHSISSEEDLTLMLGTMNISRGRSYSITGSSKLNTNISEKEEASRTKKLTGIIIQNDATCKKTVSSSHKIDKNETCESSAEYFFIDIILQRHARRLLTSQRIIDLGNFSAQLDFNLVDWMTRERNRAAKLVDYVSAVKAVHSQFIYPSNLFYRRQLGNLQNYNKSIKSVLFLDKDKDLIQNTVTDLCSDQLCDENYLNCTNIKEAALAYIKDKKNRNRYIVNSYDIEKNAKADMINDSIAKVNGNCKLPYSDELLLIQGHSATIEMNVLPAYLANELATSTKVQLRYLLQIFSAAGCFGWAIIISVILRDTSAVSHVIDLACDSFQTLESAVNLRDGLIQLVEWSTSECLGYDNVLSTLEDKVLLLQEYMNDKHREIIDTIQSSTYTSLIDRGACQSSTGYTGNVSNMQSNFFSNDSILDIISKENKILYDFSWINNGSSFVKKKSEDGNTNLSASTCILT